MGNKNHLQNGDFEKVGNAFKNAFNSTARFVSLHKIEFLAGLSITAIADNIRVRLCRKKDQKTYTYNAMIQTEIVRKHEAEIKVLSKKAEKANETINQVEQLKQIVENMIEGGSSE